MIIRNNTLSQRAYNTNRKTTNSIKKNLEKLSSGYRINRAADDVAGLGVSERIRAKVTELDRCEDNATEGIDLARTADAALQEVNDMLKRARSLCIQAENGTYSDQELAAISDEINQLFDEIDRISAGSYHNSINLFRGEIEEDFHYEYDEYFDGMGDDIQHWGEVDFIQNTLFGKAEKATRATATFKLDDSIDFNGVSTLEGRSITIGSRTFYFTSGTSSPSGSTRISLTTYNTVQKALNQLETAPDVVTQDELSEEEKQLGIKGVVIDEDARTVTLTAKLEDLIRPAEADGKTLNFLAPNGLAADRNGIVVSSPNLGQVDGSGSINNAPGYDSKITVEWTLKSWPTTFDQAQLDKLNQNTLYLYGTGESTTPRVELSALNLSVGATQDQAGAALAAEINKFGSNYSATYNGGKLSVTITGRSTTTASSDVYFSESAPIASSSDYDTANKWTSTGTNFGLHCTKPVTSAESVEEWELTLPSSADQPFSFQIGNRTYVYYNSDKNPLTSSGHSSTSWSYPTSSMTSYNTKDKSMADIQKDIENKINSAMPSSNMTVTRSGNKLIFTSKTAGTSLSLNNEIKSATVTATPYKPSASGTTYFGSSPYFQQKYTVSFDLGSTFDKDKLAGSGFSINTKRIEFTNGTGKGLSTAHTDVDISACTSFQEVANRAKAELGDSYEVTIDSSDSNHVKLVISSSRFTGASSLVIVDGDDGITDGTPVRFEGGVDTGYSQTAIDFSGISEDNLEDLLGKGFRINCATCPGEYINVFFCWTKNGDIPLEFKKLDPTTGEMRTIHNIPVELSKITSGDKIVENIVEQVKPSLNHYTDMMVGDPSTTLIAMEKRVGDVVFNGDLKLGSVETGVETNFVYRVERNRVVDLPDEMELKTANVNIYVGSDPEPQIIPIHLPYIDMTYLRLRPPKLVDLADADQSASDWLGRVDRADLAISDARGTIGADFNRLEHAVQDLSNANIQLSDAYSVIRDADMADLMMKQVKDQILLQAQQSMLSQANQVPQGVLQLMQ